MTASSLTVVISKLECGCYKGKKDKKWDHCSLRDEAVEIFSSVDEMVIKLNRVERDQKSGSFCWTDDKLPSKIDVAVDGFHLLDDGSKQI